MARLLRGRTGGSDELLQIPRSVQQFGLVKREWAALRKEGGLAALRRLLACGCPRQSFVFLSI